MIKTGFELSYNQIDKRLHHIFVSDNNFNIIQSDCTKESKKQMFLAGILCELHLTYFTN